MYMYVSSYTLNIMSTIMHVSYIIAYVICGIHIIYVYACVCVE